MNIRNAKINDAKGINSLINNYAELDKMLFRSVADIYDNLQTFIVAEDENGKIIGCCAIQVIWTDLAEIKSLAVDQEAARSGVGRALISYAKEMARKLGIANLFALTLVPEFFTKQDFEIIDRMQLPMKVWSDCARCPKQNHCDEIALICKISPA